MKVSLNNIRIVANLKKHYDYELSDIQEIVLDFCGIYNVNENISTIEDVIDYVKVEQKIVDIIRNNKFEIIEALGRRVVDEIFTIFPRFDEIFLKISKYGVMKFSDIACIEFHEKRRKNKVVLALGSNLENKSDNIQIALEEIFEKCNAHEQKISSFIESKASIRDESSPKDWHIDFINAATSFFTNLKWNEVFDITQNIQNKMNKNEKIAKDSPRIIDIDIIYFNGQIISKNDIFIPHKDCYFRDFVLIPTKEIEPEIFIL